MSDTYKKLSIQVCLNGLSFCTLNELDGNILSSGQRHFSGHQLPNVLLKQLQELLEEHQVPQQHFSNVEVVQRSNLYALVPKPLFNKEELGHYLKYNTKVLAGDEIAYDEIENQDIVNVFVPFTNINNYIFDLFGEFEFKHYGTLLLQGLLNSQTAHIAHCCYVDVGRNQMDVVVLEKKKLLLYNHFDFDTKEDFLYYLMFTLEQLNLGTETVKLRMFGAIEEGDSLFTLCQKYLTDVSVISLENMPHISHHQDMESIDLTRLEQH